MGRLALVLGWLAATLATPVLGAGWYADREAGIRFPLPFAGGQRKTPEQLRNLIAAKDAAGARASIDEATAGARLTSGLYGPKGLPYLLIWIKPDDALPTVAELEAQGFDPERRDKIVDGEAAGLRSRILVKALKDRTAFVGLFYERDADRALLDGIRVGLEVEPGLALPEGLPPGRPAAWLVALTALAGGIAGTCVWARRRRRVSPPAC